jgi:aminopeptidase N
MEDLREAMGDEVFFDFIRTYAAEHVGQIVSADDFFDTLGRFTQSDLSSLLGKYFKTR